MSNDIEMYFSTICRICMKAMENLVPIFPQNETGKSISSKIMSCASVQILNSDKLPSHICMDCLKLLYNAYLFKERCEQTDRKLQSYLTDSYKGDKELKSDDDSMFSNSDNDPCEHLNELDIKKNSKENGFSVCSDSEKTSIDDNYVCSLNNNDSKKMQAKSIKNSHQDTLLKNETLFECNTCLNKFEKLKQLKLHVRVHKKRLTKCKLCAISLNCYYDLAQHNKIHHCNNKKIKETTHFCSVCDITFKDNYFLIDHMLSKHTKKKVNIKDQSNELTCNICNKIYKNQKNLAAHMGTHTGDMPLECEICQKRFTQGRAFACHMRTHSDQLEQPFKCKNCEKKFSTENQLSVHMKKCTGQQHVCSICSKSYSNSGNLKGHMRLHTGDKPYSCHICNKKFAQSNAHSYHMKTHLGEKSFLCDTCSKSFTTSGQLINHKRLHTGEKPFACNMCPKKFTQKFACTIHLMTHTGKKPHLCNMCGKRYAQSSQLNEHIRIHNGETLQCNMCGKAYTTSGNLAAHMRTHTGIKSHVCDICNKGFYVANKLLKHKLTHTNKKPYKCSECSKSFVSSGSLKVHSQVHSEERPYSCQLCNKSFISSYQQTLHMKSHPEENSYACWICYKSFISSNDLILHQNVCSRGVIM